MQFPSRHTNIKVMDSQKCDLVLHPQSGHVSRASLTSPLSHGHPWVTSESHPWVTSFDYSSSEWLSFLWWDFPQKVVYLTQRDRAQPHGCSRPHRRRQRSAGFAVLVQPQLPPSAQGRLWNCARSSRWPSRQGKHGARPRKGESTEGTDSSGCAPKKQQRAQQWGNMLGERILVHSAAQELLLTGGFALVFFSFSPRKTHESEFCHGLTAPSTQVIKEN